MLNGLDWGLLRYIPEATIETLSKPFPHNIIIPMICFLFGLLPFIPFIKKKWKIYIKKNTKTNSKLYDLKIFPFKAQGIPRDLYRFQIGTSAFLVDRKWFDEQIDNFSLKTQPATISSVGSREGGTVDNSKYELTFEEIKILFGSCCKFFDKTRTIDLSKNLCSEMELLNMNGTCTIKVLSSETKINGVNFQVITEFSSGDYKIYVDHE
ncbi:MAG TPA: hypothetical protein PK295_03830 [Candidatus Magasanikbacteria bacterium]|nr:hypothetical protein [Candidatus Magasanikbacteria bacterium]